ncbi:MAG TPA: helix-turn-helix domain-containing protein [Chloroflexota bacterium]
MTQDELLSVPEIASRLKVRAETVREWLRSGQINGYNFGGRTGWRIPASEVDRLLAANAGMRHSDLHLHSGREKKSAE